MYSPAVRIGNWLEDLELEKEKTALFVRKCRSKELLVQHTRLLFNNLFRETRLSSNNGFIQFGNCIQLKAPDVPRFPPSSLSLPTTPGSGNNNDDDECGLVMSGTIHDKHIGIIPNLVNDCRLVASPILVPCARNCFVIKSADQSDRNGENLLFGQEFVLQMANSEGDSLYVRAEMPLIDQAHGPRGHRPIVLSNKKDRYCMWKVLHWNKDIRFESEGAPFPPFNRIVIRNLMSGLDLAIESTVWWLSIFGAECGMSGHTYVDSWKQETAECAWMFVTRETNESFACNHDV